MTKCLIHVARKSVGGIGGDIWEGSRKLCKDGPVDLRSYRVNWFALAPNGLGANFEFVSFCGTICLS